MHSLPEDIAQNIFFNGQLLEMNSSFDKRSYGTWKYFHHQGIDLAILKAFSVSAAILIVTTNGCLLAKLNCLPFCVFQTL